MPDIEVQLAMQDGVDRVMPLREHCPRHDDYRLFCLGPSLKQRPEVFGPEASNRSIKVGCQWKRDSGTLEQSVGVAASSGNCLVGNGYISSRAASLGYQRLS